MAFKVGDRVECWSKDEGFLDSYYEADVQSVSGKRCLIKYVEMLTDDGDNLIENLPLEQLRPLPPRIDSFEKDPEFQPGSSIEAHHQDGWWKGAIARRVEPEHYMCYFLSNGIEQLEFHYSELRTRQDWVNGVWVVKGAKGSPPHASAAPPLELPSPCTPESPSPRHQTQGKGTPLAESYHSEGFILDNEDDIDIENFLDGPALRTDTPVMAAALPPLDEEGTVSDLGRSSSDGGVEQEVPSQAVKESLGGKGATKSLHLRVVSLVQKKRKGTIGELEGSPSRKKPRKAEPCAQKRSSGGENTRVEDRASKKLESSSFERIKGGAEKLERGAFVFRADEVQRERSETYQGGGAKTKAGVPGFGSSPFGKSTVMRWGTKQRSMTDVMRRSSHVDPRGFASSYELECEINEERRKAHRKVHARHLAARNACQLAPQLDAELLSEQISPQSWDVASDVAAHVAFDGATDYLVASDVAAYNWEDDSTAWRQGRGVRRVSFREPIEEMILRKESEVPEGDGWCPGDEERPCLAIEPVQRGYDNAQFPSEAPSERFSFRGAYGSILEALLRKNMPTYRREYLLAELRSELHISDRCHAKQYHRAMERISGMPE